MPPGAGNEPPAFFRRAAETAALPPGADAYLLADAQALKDTLELLLAKYRLNTKDTRAILKKTALISAAYFAAASGAGLAGGNTAASGAAGGNTAAAGGAAGGNTAGAGLAGGNTAASGAGTAGGNTAVSGTAGGNTAASGAGLAGGNTAASRTAGGNAAASGTAGGNTAASGAAGGNAAASGAGAAGGNTAASGAGTAGGNTAASGTAGAGPAGGNTAASGAAGGNTAASGAAGGNTAASGAAGGNAAASGAGLAGGNTAASGAAGGNTAGSGTAGGNTAGSGAGLAGGNTAASGAGAAGSGATGGQFAVQLRGKGYPAAGAALVLGFSKLWKKERHAGKPFYYSERYKAALAVTPNVIYAAGRDPYQYADAQPIIPRLPAWIDAFPPAPAAAAPIAPAPAAAPAAAPATAPASAAAPITPASAAAAAVLWSPRAALLNNYLQSRRIDIRFPARALYAALFPAPEGYQETSARPRAYRLVLCVEAESPGRAVSIQALFRLARDALAEGAFSRQALPALVKRILRAEAAVDGANVFIDAGLVTGDELLAILRPPKGG